MAFWGVEVKPGEPYVHESSRHGRLCITQATLGNYDDVGWTTLECSVGDRSPVRLCTLSSTTTMYRLDLEYEEKEHVVLSVIGNCSVHLSGKYINCHNTDHGSYTKKPSGKATSQDTHGMSVGSLRNPIIFDGDDNGGGHIPTPIALSNRRTSKKRKSNTPSIEAVPNYQNNSMDRENEQRDSKIMDSNVVDIDPGQPHEITKEENDIHSAGEENNVHGDGSPIHKKMLDSKMLVEELKSAGSEAEKALKGQEVCVKYVGKLKDGKAVDPRKGSGIHTFELGAGRVILGWDHGIDGMRVGETRRLTIPPALGYGEIPKKRIPANSWLVYEVELLWVSWPEKKPQASVNRR